MDHPIHHDPDYFEKAQRERNLPQGTGVPDFESLLILALVRNRPGALKKEIVQEMVAYIDAKSKAESNRSFLRYIDYLVGLGDIARYDFRLYLTPRGEQRLLVLRQQMRSAMRMLSLGQ